MAQPGEDDWLPAEGLSPVSMLHTASAADLTNHCTQPHTRSTYSWSQPQVNSALHPTGVAKSSTSDIWGKGGKVTTAGWQVVLCDTHETTTQVNSAWHPFWVAKSSTSSVWSKGEKSPLPVAGDTV